MLGLGLQSGLERTVPFISLSNALTLLCSWLNTLNVNITTIATSSIDTVNIIIANFKLKLLEMFENWHFG